MRYLRLLLFPFSLLYGLVVVIRNWCYDAGIFKSRKFYVPVVSVGNLAVGGAGKSPMTEYLIRLMKPHYRLATLSRGYGRKTKGFLIATLDPLITGHLAAGTVPTTSHINISRKIGDEPAQFAQKFPDITVAVCEDRVAGIKQLKISHNLIILDDAYQHRAVKPALSLLLFDYNSLYEPRLLLPAGNLREPYSGRKRAQAIIVSKCPDVLSSEEQQRALQRVRPLDGQPVYFTSIAYLPLQKMDGSAANEVIGANTTVLLLTGIANPAPLVRHIENSTPHIIHHNYPDHHRFSLKNIAKLAAEFKACPAAHKVIITTEKDAQRLAEYELTPLVKQLPILVLPIGVSFLNGAQPQFDKFVVDHVTEHIKHYQLR